RRPFPISFQLLLKNLGSDALTGFCKVVERQRSNDGNDIGIDYFKRKRSAAFEFAQEFRFGNSRRYTSVCQANRVRNEHRGILIYGEPDSRLQKVSDRNEDLQSCGGRILAFDKINLEDYLA